MTDVFLSYAREDRERVRRIADALLASGFDVWWDPSEPRFDKLEEDTKLQAAACVIVVWSQAARRLDYVRSEAATGLYRNKLVQIGIDGTEPPRPFDHLGMADLAGWRGDREHSEWRRLTTAIRTYVGQRPEPAQPALKIPKRVEPPRQKSASRKPSSSGPSAAPVVGALVLLVAVGAGLWFADPMGWRAGASQPQAKQPARSAPAKPVSADAAAKAEAAERDWAKIDRKDAAALRTYLIAHPASSGAEAARSLLRVLDAQAWSEAVAADTEAAYAGYLKHFPADTAVPGGSAKLALERLGALGGEREQAVRQVQLGLSVLGLYAGEIDGKAGKGTQEAAVNFARAQKLSEIDLATEAPAELYAFADLVGVEARRADRALTAEARPQTP